MYQSRQTPSRVIFETVALKSKHLIGKSGLCSRSSDNTITGLTVEDRRDVFGLFECCEEFIQILSSGELMSVLYGPLLTPSLVNYIIGSNDKRLPPSSYTYTTEKEQVLFGR